MITLRFMTGKGVTHTLIRAQERTTYPFIPSHVEAVDPDTGKWIGAHWDGGVQARPVGYDLDTLLTYTSPTTGEQLPTQLFLNLDATDTQTRIFYSVLRSKIGAPYDWKAILDFVAPTDMHATDHMICSALQAFALTSALWFGPLACPAHATSPRDLFLILSGRMTIAALPGMSQ